MSPASIYSHFGTKETLFAAVTGRLLEEAATRLAAAYAAPGSPLDRMKAAGLAYIRFLLVHPVVVRALVSPALGGPASAEVRERIEALRADFQTVIEVTVASGDLSPVDERLLSYFLFGAWNGVAALTHAVSADQLSENEVEQTIQQAMSMMSGEVSDNSRTLHARQTREAVSERPG